MHYRRRRRRQKKTAPKKSTIFKLFICTPKQQKSLSFVLLTFQEHIQVIFQKISL